MKLPWQPDDKTNIFVTIEYEIGCVQQILLKKYNRINYTGWTKIVLHVKQQNSRNERWT